MEELGESVISRQLDQGERLLWSGQPRGGVRLRGQDVFLIPFSLMWGGFAIFWEFGVLKNISKIHNAMGIIFPLWGVPFVMVGLYLIFGRFIVDARSRSKTLYGVTNERIIIVSGIFTRQTKSLPLRALTDISITEKADGSGTISFGPTVGMNGVFRGSSWPGYGRSGPPAFDMIERAKGVYDIIRGAQRKIA